MQLSISVAMSENRCIGRDNRLPWHLPDEWAYFQSVTDGKPFVMGRKSYESADGLYSTYRTIVISRRKGLQLPACFEQAHSLHEALKLVAHEDVVFVLGGVSIFEELLPRVDKLYLTLVHTHIEGDVYFPNLNFTEWELTYSQHHPADDRHAYSFSMNQYVRK